jgi:outer membrane protein TolC
MIRRSRLPIAFFLIFVLFASGTAYSEVYTLDECIETALKNNYGVIAARNSYDAARGEVYTGWGDLLPSISVSARANQSWSGFERWDELSLQYVSGAQRVYSYSGNLNFSRTYPGLGLYNYANLRKKYHDRGSSFHNYVRARSDLILAVKEGYYNLLKAKMLLDVAEDAVKRGEERLRVVQSRYDLGAASMSDVLKAKVQYGNDKLDRLSKTNAYKLATANLAYSMGIDVNRDFKVAEEMPERHIDISFGDAFSEALSRNPDYRKARFDLYGARDQKLMAYSNFLPSLSVGLSHSTNVGKFGDLTDFEMPNASYYLSASVNFNIFNGASDYATLRASQKNVDTYEQNLEDTKNRVALEIKQAFLDIEQSGEARKLAEESVAAAQEDLNLVREKYNLGAATILEVLDAEVSFKEAQTNRVQAIFDYNLAIFRLEKVIGR